MVPPQLNHKYAIVKLYPGLDETIFGKLLKPADALEDPPTPPSSADERAVREWMALIEFIETNVNVDLDAKSLEPSSNDASVQTSESETASSKMEDGAPKVITCMLCQEEVPRDKKSLKLHVQTHSGKRYGCSRCKYHTDRKFDFTRHIRRRHEGKPDPYDGGSRPHWMSLLRSCFPNYTEVMRFRRPRRSKSSRERQSGDCAKQQSSGSPFPDQPSAHDVAPIVC
uniref:C2H2-type domain-containing protein n=1 Tax=Haemonchus contortus TaxID=6289 RepID=A0A7I4YWR9_HAECO